MTPVNSPEEYIIQRNTMRQVCSINDIRRGVDVDKNKRNLVQFNYSCLPNDDGTLKGTKRMSNSVGMDIDHIDKEQMDEVKKLILSKRDELGLQMLELSARGAGYHLVFRRREELSQEDNLKWASQLLGVQYDEAAKDITRVFFASTGSAKDLIFLSPDLFVQRPSSQPSPSMGRENSKEKENDASRQVLPIEGEDAQRAEEGLGYEVELLTKDYMGISFKDIIAEWWKDTNGGKEPALGGRNTLLFGLAVNLRHLLGFNVEAMKKVIPRYELPEEEFDSIMKSAVNAYRSQMPVKLTAIIDRLRARMEDGKAGGAQVEEEEEPEHIYVNDEDLPDTLRQCVRSSGEGMTMPVLLSTASMMGALATDVKVMIHGRPMHLNLHAFIVGEAGSGKGKIADLVDEFMFEEISKNREYFKQEDELRRQKRAAKNEKKQPKEEVFPVRFITLNNTVANIAERLSATPDKHSFSFTEEAAEVANKWGSSLTDFSTMLRLAWDNSRYDKEAKTADAAVCHIDALKWNVCLCGTPDVLYKVMSNKTDGLLSRFCIARTPDNTFTRLEDVVPYITEECSSKIHTVAHLLPFVSRVLELPHIEDESRRWLNDLIDEALKTDDKVKARARMRDHNSAFRIMAGIALCECIERMVAEHGAEKAELMLRDGYDLTSYIKAEDEDRHRRLYRGISDSLIECDMYFFRQGLTAAYNADEEQTTKSDIAHKRDTTFEDMPNTFTVQQLSQFLNCTMAKAYGLSHTWRVGGLIEKVGVSTYRKVRYEDTAGEDDKEE